MSLSVVFAGIPGPEAEAAWSWLSGHTRISARRETLAQVAAAAGGAEAVWIHCDGPVDEVDPDRLADRVRAGTRLVLTLRACGLVVPMGLETEPPNDQRDAVWHHDTDEHYAGVRRDMSAYPHRRGMASYGPHPLMAGLHNGAFIWAPTEGERWSRCCYRRGERPAVGEVVAVERAYLAQNPDRIVAWEYGPGQSRVLCIGAYVNFASPDPLLRPQLERLMENALLEPESPDRATWPEPATAAVRSEALALPAPWDLDGALPDPGADPVGFDGPVEADEPYDLAGRRVLLVGSERGGPAELWVHPHRVLASWEATADDEQLVGASLRVAPDLVVRTLETSRRRVTETTFVALEHPVAMLEYHAARRGRESVGRAPARLELSFTLDLRRMWPFPGGSSGNLRFRQDGDGRVVLVESESDDGAAAILLSRPCEIVTRPQRGRNLPVVECRIGTTLSLPLRIAVVAGVSRADFDRALRAARRLGVAGLVRQRLQRAATVRESRLAAHAPDPRVQRAVEWAKRRLDLFLGEAPGVGRSLLGGYATSGGGWADGRPGYAWFFGRDSCWSAFALLASGEYSIPRQVIRFLGDSQDVTGKVVHEATTSGQFHYDAADSTPLYLLLVGRYLAWSGDKDFVASIWPHVERALAFCIATDRDGDGLIENSGVGHGWIESGPLGGAHVTLYLAAVWRAALEAIAAAAGAIGEARASSDCWARAARAGATIESQFSSEAAGGYALDRRADGSFTWTQTALQSVALLLGAANPLRARAYLDALAGPAFNAEWGVRLVPVTDPLFNPEGYHSGTVWPLFTGWAALAEYRSGRPEAGFGHLMANVALAFRRQKGAFDEALHGLVEQPAGICPNQAWSAAMVVSPFVEGLLGAVPDAPAHRLTLAPCLPADWEWLDVAGLRCGETVYDLRLRRRAGALTVRLRRELGPPLWLTVAPWSRETPRRVEIDGNPVRPQSNVIGAAVRSAVSLEGSGEHEIVFA